MMNADLPETDHVARYVRPSLVRPDGSVRGAAFGLRNDEAGLFHKVSAKHLDRYLEELEWRFGNRDNDHIFVDTLRRMVTTGNLTYRELVK